MREASEQRARTWDVEYVMPSVGDPLPGNCRTDRSARFRAESSYSTPSIRRRSANETSNPNAEEFIVDWAKEASPSATFGLCGLPGPAGRTAERNQSNSGKPCHEFFRHRAELSRQRAARALSPWQDSLVIGPSAHSVPTLAAGNLVVEILQQSLAGCVREGLLMRRVGRHVEVHRSSSTTGGRSCEAVLATIDRRDAVRISTTDGSADAWRWDWPVAPSAARAVHSEPIESPKADRL